MQDINSNRGTSATDTPTDKKTCQKAGKTNSLPTFDLLESQNLGNAM